MEYIVNKPNFHKAIGLFTQISYDKDTYIHRHEYYEIFYILNGTIEHSCNNVTEKLFVGDFLILRPDDVHQFIRNPSVKCTHRDILVVPELFEDVMNFLLPEFLSSMLASNKPFKTTLNVNKLQAFESILNTFNSLPTTETDLVGNAKCVLTNIMSDILLNNKDSVDYNKMPSLIKNIISLLNTTDGIMYGIPSVIQQYNYSPIYLSRIFKKYLGITMTDYLKNVRLNYAELYLQTTSLTLEEITEQVGLSSMSYLNKLFKEKHGITPIRYRNLYKKNNTNAK